LTAGATQNGCSRSGCGPRCAVATPPLVIGAHTMFLDATPPPLAPSQ
jgi:hypothetical protein